MELEEAFLKGLLHVTALSFNNSVSNRPVESSEAQRDFSRKHYVFNKGRVILSPALHNTYTLDATCLYDRKILTSKL